MRNKEPIETEDPTIRTKPYGGFVVNPYRLRRSEYLILTTPFKYTVFSNILLGIFLSLIFLDLRKYLDSNGPFKIENYRTDIIIAIVIVALYVICIALDLLSNPRRELRKKIKEHYRKDSERIDEQRNIYG